MKFLTTLTATTLLATSAMAAGHLPDLGGQETVVVTENAYPPLQFHDSYGNAVGGQHAARAESADSMRDT